MGRKKFILSDTEQSRIAYNWLLNKKLINSDTNINISDFSMLNNWCESNLNAKQWTLIKSAIRQKRSKKRVTVPLSIEAHLILSDMAKLEGLTLSNYLIKMLKPEWVKVSNELLPSTKELEETEEEKKEIKLPASIEEYNALIESFKSSKEWEWVTKHRDIQNMTRILKAKNIVLPNNETISKPKLENYLKNLKQ